MKLTTQIKIFFFAGLILISGLHAEAQTVSFTANNQQIKLLEVPGIYSAGYDSTSNTHAPAKTISPKQAGISSEKEILPGHFVIKTTGTKVSPQAVKQYGGYNYIYPVYKFVNSNLKVYPKPEVIVKVKQGTDIQALAGKYNLIVLHPLLFTTDQFVLKLDANLSPFDVAKTLRADDAVIWATPNLTREVKKNYKPNDPLYPKQWHLNNTGQFGGKAGADVSAEKAWDLIDANTELVIAVVDDGVDIKHPDLNIYTNPAEVNGKAGVDDDNNGLADDIHGWNFVSNTNDPSPVDGPEGDHHGTSVAGVAAAIGDNNIGVSGAAPGIKVLPVKMLGNGNKDAAVTEDEMTANAIRYAAKYADIMNNSWGGPVLPDAEREALTFAVSDQGKRGDKQVPVLFASGNDSFDVPMITYTKDVELTEGNHTITFEYQKNASGSAGNDMVQITNAEFKPADESDETITISGDDVEFFGDSPFAVGKYTDGGYQIDCYQSGKITDNQSSLMVWTFTVSKAAAYTLKIQFLASTEKGSDFFHIKLDDVDTKETFESGNKTFEMPYSGIVPDDYNPAPIVGENLHPEVYNIGATTDGDIRSSYSQWGKELAFCAPSNGGIKGIYTTDVTGTGKGYDPNSDYTETDDSLFGGTSSACPLASGIVAMVITANPDLTRNQIYTVLKDTTDKIQPYSYDSNGFNMYVGYGKLNMYAAVKRALDLKSTPVSVWELY